MTDARTERTRHMHMMGPHNGPGGPTRTRVQGRCAGIHLYTRLHAHRGTHTHTHTLHGSTQFTGSATIRGARIVESVTDARGRQAGPYPESVAGGSTDDGVMSSPQSITITVALLKARLCVFHCVRAHAHRHMHELPADRERASERVSAQTHELPASP
jgi:hypothetical protein